MGSKKIIYTSGAPKAIGPYSQAVIGNAELLVFTAGQIPLDPMTGQVVEGGIDSQTKRVLNNLSAVLKAAGSGLDRVIKTTIFLKDMNDFGGMNQVYETYFSIEPPARTTVQVTRLPKDVLIEIECVALAGS